MCVCWMLCTVALLLMCRQVRDVAGDGMLILTPLDDTEAVSLACAALGVRELGAGTHHAAVLMRPQCH